MYPSVIPDCPILFVGHPRSSNVPRPSFQIVRLYQSIPGENRPIIRRTLVTVGVFRPFRKE